MAISWSATVIPHFRYWILVAINFLLRFPADCYPFALTEQLVVMLVRETLNFVRAHFPFVRNLGPT